MTAHETIRDNLAAYALGSLDGPAAQSIEQHLKQCEECRRILVEYEEVLRLLPFGLPETVPSPGARTALIERIRSGHDRRRSFAGSSGSLRRYRYPALAALGVLVLVLAAVGGVLQRADTDTPVEVVTALRNDPETLIVPMRDASRVTDGVGQLILQPGERQAGLVVSGLPELPSGQVYQFWSIRPDEMHVPGGVFVTDDRSEAIVVVEVPSDYGSGWGCSVTIEPVGGSAAPSGQSVLRGWYPDEW